MAKQIYRSEYVFSARAIKELLSKIEEDDLDTTSLAIRVLIHDEHEGKVFKFEVQATTISDTDDKDQTDGEVVPGCPRPPGC